MNLTNLSQTIKKYLWTLPLIVVLIILGIIFLYKNSQDAGNRKLAPKISTTYIDVITKSFDVSKLKIEGQEIKKANIYESVQGQNLLDRFADYKSILKIEGQETEINDSIFKEGRRVFTKNGSLFQVFKNYLYFSKPGTKAEKSQEFKPDSELAQSAARFFEELSINIPQEFNVTYTHFAGEFEYEDKTKADSYFINLIFIPKLSNIKVYSPNIKVRASFNKANDLITATYSSKDAAPKEAYPLITPKEAVQSLTLNTKPVRIYGEGELYIKTKQSVDKVTLTNAYLAYFSSEKETGQITPVWIFEGEAIVSGKTLYLDYALDAIKPQLLINN